MKIVAERSEGIMSYKTASVEEGPERGTKNKKYNDSRESKQRMTLGNTLQKPRPRKKSRDREIFTERETKRETESERQVDSWTEREKNEKGRKSKKLREH